MRLLKEALSLADYETDPCFEGTGICHTTVPTDDWSVESNENETHKRCVFCVSVYLSHMFMFGAYSSNRHIITEYVKVYLAGFSEVQHPTHLQ